MRVELVFLYTGLNSIVPSLDLSAGLTSGLHVRPTTSGVVRLAAFCSLLLFHLRPPACLRAVVSSLFGTFGRCNQPANIRNPNCLCLSKLWTAAVSFVHVSVQARFLPRRQAVPAEVKHPGSNAIP